MSDHERRYREDEVLRIFEMAAAPRDGQGEARSAADGLTLAELQEIGREVGLSSARVAEAAAALEASPAAAARPGPLGTRASVGRTVSLPRLPTDAEWELILVDLRETFGARGRDGSRGNLREWTNGNLYALVEPTQAGVRLRLGSRKADAAVVTFFGTVWLLVALVTLATLAVSDDLLNVNALLPVIYAAVGAAALGYNRHRLTGWAEAREAQMAHVAERARALLSGPASSVHSSREEP